MAVGRKWDGVPSEKALGLQGKGNSYSLAEWNFKMEWKSETKR
jgi:hypothetical protein